MRKIVYAVLVIFLLIAFGYCLTLKPSLSKMRADTYALIRKIIQKEQPLLKPPETQSIERIGEKIVYDIKLGKLNLGKAKYSHLSRVELDGKAASHMTFETKVVRFTDLEKIYSDPITFLPLKIERDISSWPISEKITEHYDQKNFTLTISKHKSGKKEQRLIKKDGPIHNAIMLPFYVRRIDTLGVGWSMTANLPHQQFEIRLVSIEEVSVPAGSFRAYHFISRPQRFEIWMSADERKIPVKIKGSGALGYTFMMREYTANELSNFTHTDTHGLK